MSRPCRQNSPVAQPLSVPPALPWDVLTWRDTAFAGVVVCPPQPPDNDKFVHPLESHMGVSDITT